MPQASKKRAWDSVRGFSSTSAKPDDTSVVVVACPKPDKESRDQLSVSAARLKKHRGGRDTAYDC